MDTAAIVAAIAAVPATLGAVAAVISARRTSVGNDAIADVRNDIARLSEKVTRHVDNRRLHRG